MSSEGSSLSTFFATHQRTIIICTAAAVSLIAAASVYYATSSPRPSTKPPKRRKEKGEKKRKDGPIIEEREPKKTGKTVDQVLDQVGADADPAAQAAALKAEGNVAYKDQDYKTAVELYTKAIQVSPKEEAVFYSNRAACYMNLQPPNYDLAIQDCTAALALNPAYIKALNRRANAYESTSQYQLALNDFTASTFLQKFADTSSAASVERVLKKLAEGRADEIMTERAKEERLPSHTFITAYFAAFRPRSPPSVPEQPSEGDLLLRDAFDALSQQEYQKCLALVREALEKGVSTDAGKAEALNLRGTFKFLLGQVESAKQDFLESLRLVPNFTQSWVKIASVYMEQGDPAKAFESFESAISHNSNDADIYYHRGQVLFITAQFDEAAENYKQSTNLDPDFIFSHIQRAVAEYKAGNVAKSMMLFRKILEDEKWAGRSEGFNYYGELLLDQSRYQDAIEKFDKAIDIELAKSKDGSVKGPPNVLPLVNKSLALYQWKSDFPTAETYCLQALELDPTCDAAISSLAQFNLQQASIAPGSGAPPLPLSSSSSGGPATGQERMQKAISYLDRQVDLARTKEEVVGTLQYRFASEAQMRFAETYPKEAGELAGLARMGI